jgi:hypothetical protein
VRVSPLVCAAMVGVLLGCGSWQDVKSKEEYGLLQRVEYEHRGRPVSGMEVIQKNGYVVAGFQAAGREQNVWILLNPRYSPQFKQVPEAPFLITQEDIANLRRTPGIASEVLAVLEARAAGPGS